MNNKHAASSDGNESKLLFSTHSANAETAAKTITELYKWMDAARIEQLVGIWHNNVQKQMWFIYISE